MSCRRFAIADIHGCALTFMALLTLIDLRSRDTLFILGDSIDRGPGSKEILDVLLRLTGNGYDIRVLRGNHEDMVLRCVSGHHDEYSQAWLGWWGEATLRSFGVTIPSEIPEEYLRFIGSMPPSVHVTSTSGYFTFEPLGVGLSGKTSFTDWALGAQSVSSNVEFPSALVG